MNRLASSSSSALLLLLSFAPIAWLSAGCSAAVDSTATGGSELSSAAADDAASDPGSAVLEYGLGVYCENCENGDRYTVTKSTTDEYLRNGEAISLSIEAQNIFLAYDQSFWDATTLDGEARFTRGGAIVSTLPLSFTPFGTDPDPFHRIATSAAVVIPQGADSVTLAVTAHNPARPDLQINTTTQSLNAVPLTIIGAYEPNKLVLFDTSGGSLRNRTLEGGALEAGADATIAYTDYRVETVIDSSTIDTTVAHNRIVIDRGGDYGSPEPVDGTLDFEVWAATYDNVNGWSREVQLTKNTNPNLFVPLNASPRFDYTETFGIAKNATNVQVYFHTKAYLTSPSVYGGIVVDQRFAPGTRNLVRERYDNPNGAGTNYSFAAE